MNLRLLKIGILYLIIIFVITSILIASADILPEGQKDISTCYKINNLEEYDEYVFLTKSWMVFSEDPKYEYAIINKDDCFSRGGTRYGTGIICAILQSEFNESDFSENASKFNDYFEDDPYLTCANINISNYGSVSENHPLDHAVVTAEIVNINETKLEIKKMSVNYTYTDSTYEEKDFIDQNSFPTPSKGFEDNKEIPILWFIAIPLVALIGIILVILKRKRK